MIETPRLLLEPVTLPLVEAVFAGDRAALEDIIQAKVPAGFPGRALVERAFSASLDAIQKDPPKRLWGDKLMITKDGERLLIGSVIFHGRPDDGIAEVGYGVEEGSRGQGLASEATRACVEWALAQAGITAVRATTFPWHAASLGVIRKVGMQPCGTRSHELFGDLLVFERKRSES